jgi:hypothetical protein
MAGLVPAIHVFGLGEDVDARDIGERPAFVRCASRGTGFQSAEAQGASTEATPFFGYAGA